MLNLNKVFPRLSIRNKLAIGFVLVALLPVAAVTAVGVRDSVELINQAAASTLAGDIELAESEAARALSSAQAHVRLFARLLEEGPFRGSGGSQRGLAALGGEISRQLTVEPTLWRVRVFSTEGDQVLAVDGTGARETGTADDASPYYAWRAQAIPSGGVVILPVEVRLGANTVAALAILAPLHAPDGELIGVVVGEARAAASFTRIEHATHGYEGITGIVDAQGLFLYHSERKREWGRLLAVRQNETLRSDFEESVAARVLSGKVGAIETGDGQLVAFRPLDLGPGEADGLTLYRAVPLQRLRAPVGAFLSRVFVLGVIAMAIVLAAAVLAANQFTKPIIAMRGATARIAAGEDVALMPVATNDEIEDLAQDLGSMGRTIATQRAELQALLSEQGRALERTRAALADVVDHSADAIIMMDADGVVTAWNQGAARLFGYPTAEAVGEPMEQLIGRDGPGVERELAYFTRELALHGEVVNYATERRTRDGQLVPVSLTLTRIRSPEGAVAGLSCILRDNRMQAQLDEQLSRSERLVAVSVLAAGLAHEVNTPLAILGNRIEVMQRELDRARPEVLREDLGVLAAHVARLGAVTSGLLRFAREDDGNEAYLDIGGLARRVTSLLERMIVQRRLRLDVAIADGLGTVRANERAIETVLVNLLINAADATPPGGTVSLRIVCLEDEGAVRITVADTGSGVPAELRERIFEPFFTTKPEGRGTGLGLTVCRSIIERHGGRLEVGDVPGGGASFTVTLYHEPARFTWMARAS